MLLLVHEEMRNWLWNIAEFWGDQFKKYYIARVEVLLLKHYLCITCYHS